MPRLSILVPLSGPIQPFENTLASVLQNRPADCDILVVHPESYDDPWSLSNEVQFLEAPVDTPLLEMLDACLPYVRGEILHIVQGGIEVTEGWADAALAEFRRPDVVAVSPLVLNAADLTTVVAHGVDYRTGGQRVVAGAGLPYRRGQSVPPPVLGPTFRAGFYRTELLAQLGGWETSVGEYWADVDLALTLASAGLECVASERSVVLGSPETPVVNSLTNSRCGERVFWRHAAHRGWIGSLVAHPYTVALTALRDLPAPRALTQLIGRLLAITEGSRYSEFRHDLQQWLDARAATTVADDANPRRTNSGPTAAESAATKAAPPSRRHAA